MSSIDRPESTHARRPGSADDRTGSPDGASTIGLFSTLTSTGSRAIVGHVIDAVASGALGAVEVAFVFVNRAAGESAVTDESVAQLERRGMRVVRASAVAFERAARKAARAAAAQGDEAPLWAWRDRFYASYREALPSTDLDLLLGDMWIWGAAQCAERRGVNLHPSLPSGPLGKMWFDVVWDLIETGATESGVMLHRVTPEVDRGPIVSWCRYALDTPAFAPLWAEIPPPGPEREALVARERPLRRACEHPLFRAVRAAGFLRETPLMLQTVRAVAEGQLRLADGRVLDGAGRGLPQGLELSAQVERMVRRGTA